MPLDKRRFHYSYGLPQSPFFIHCSLSISPESPIRRKVRGLVLRLKLSMLRNNAYWVGNECVLQSAFLSKGESMGVSHILILQAPSRGSDPKLGVRGN